MSSLKAENFQTLMVERKSEKFESWEEFYVPLLAHKGGGHMRSNAGGY